MLKRRLRGKDTHHGDEREHPHEREQELQRLFTLTEIADREEEGKGREGDGQLDAERRAEDAEESLGLRGIGELGDGEAPAREFGAGELEGSRERADGGNGDDDEGDPDG